MAKKIKIPTSVELLYTIFVLTIINLGYFILYEDNKSLLLFMCISAVVYLIECNMIYSLLYPLIIVNGLNLLRKIMNSPRKEGFISDEKFSKEDKVKMLSWLQENMDSDSMMEYLNYNTSIDDKLLPLSNILDNISVTEISETDTDFDDIDELIRYVRKINKIEDADEDELKFVNKMVDQMMEKLGLSNSDEEVEEEILDDKKETEEEEIKDDNKEEMYVNMIKDTISKKENEIDELKKELDKKTK